MCRGMRLYSLCFLVVTIVSLLSCGGSKGVSDVVGENVPLRHSSLLSIVECDGYTVVDVKNPWRDGLLQRYLLVPRDSALPKNMPQGRLLRTPLERSIVFSGVHASLFEELGMPHAVTGVCDADYIYSPVVMEGILDGTVVDCGSSLNVNREKVMEVSPEAIFVLPYENGGYGKLESMPYTLVECADYMENSPLGCAEWMRFYGRLLGKGQESDSVFAAVCGEYESLCGLAATAARRPLLMCELKSASAWYVPGGNSTMGRMYQDAGADYVFSLYESRGSVPLSFEVVLDKAAEADIWLLKYNSPVNRTIASLLDEFPGYGLFRPLKEGRVYACNTRRDNIFESTSFHPERLLKELVALFHPELVADYETEYYEKMQ